MEREASVCLKARMLQFSVDVVRAVQEMPRTQATEVIGKQVVRSATSVGANYRSACKGRSRAEFVAKLAIAEEEADETQYWLELLHQLGMLEELVFRALFREARELTAILASSGKTAKQGMKDS